MRTVAFNPVGGFLPAAIFLAVTIPVGIGLLLREKESSRKIFLGAGVAVVAFGLIMAIFNLLPGKDFSPRFPTAATSWSVAIDSLKESPIFGIGPGNYLTAFSRFRPISYNTTDLWALRFGTGHDFYLTVFTEAGLLGAAGLILLLLTFFKFARKKVRESNLANWGQSGNTYLFSTGLLIILLALFPATAFVTMVIFILLSFTSEERKTSLNLSTPVAAGPEGAGPAGASSQATQKIVSRLPAIFVTLPVIFLVLAVGLRAGRVLAAEARFKSALDALIANDTQTYDLMREAININPQVDRYHISYSQVNLALANAIAQNPNITDQDRANIAQLIQQAIREGKAAVALNPLRATNWEILGRIYQSLIPFAQGADAFAIQSYRQAVALDPINPNLRIALGGVHYAQGNYDTAVRVFELAAVAKPDHANAHYNLAFAYRESGDIDNAINQMTIVLSLLDRTSPDYESARSALEDLESRRVGSTETPAGEELIPPQPAEEPVIVPPLELPEESEPPEAPISPTPTPTGTEAEEGEEGEVTPTVTPEPTIEP
jgi:tetratricopeptide (TPR) repeat protein